MKDLSTIETKKNKFIESPDTVHGRLMESTHLAGYTIARACKELEWLIEDNKWQRIGKGFDNINDFLATIDLSEFKIDKERRKKLAEKLETLKASQRATARALGVAPMTINQDLKNVQNCTQEQKQPTQNQAIMDDNVQNCTPLPEQSITQGPIPNKSGEETLKALEKTAKKEQKQANLEEQKQKILKESRKTIKEAEEKPIIKHLDAVTFLEIFKDESIDLLLTDPPYSTDIKDIRGFVESWVLLALKKIKKTGRVYIFTGAYPKEIYEYLKIFLENDHNFDVNKILIWTYKNTLGPSPKKEYKLNYQIIFNLIGPEAINLDCPIMTEQFSVQEINAPDGRQGDRYHTWQKPIDLSDMYIRHSTKKGDLIVDPFAGTGTFLISGAKLGRRTIGAENNIDMINIAEKRGCIFCQDHGKKI